MPDGVVLEPEAAYAENLEAAAQDVEWVGDGLGDSAGDGAGAELAECGGV